MLGMTGEGFQAWLGSLRTAVFYLRLSNGLAERR